MAADDPKQMSVPDSSGAHRNPLLFVVGCQRSGTTMLQRMLDAHPMLTVAYDSLFITRVIKGKPVGYDPVLTDKIVRTASSHPRFERLGLTDDAVERAAGGGGRYSDFISRIYDELAAQHNKPYAGEKSPGYCRHLPRLHALLPWVRIVHLIRDGRDIALSIKDWGKGAAKMDLWQSEPIAAGALWWKRDVTRGCRDGRALADELYREIRYEDLTSDPATTLKGVCEFLGLPYDPAMVEYHKGRTKEGEGLSAKAAWLPPTTGLRDWRSQMSEREREIFQAIAGDQLEMLGYEPGCARISESAAKVARECEEWWQQEMDLPDEGGQS